MNEANPYAPPRTPVADPVIAEQIGPCPHVERACQLLWWVTRKLRQGRNWMRWLYTIANLLTTAFSLLAITGVVTARRDAVLSVWRDNPLLGASTLTQLTFGLAAMVLLHTRTSREWFRAMSQSA